MGLARHWTAIADTAPGALRQVESCLNMARAIHDAALPAAQQALLQDLADSADGWAAVRRRLPPDLTADNEAFFRWQRAARQRWQRRLRSLRPG